MSAVVFDLDGVLARQVPGAGWVLYPEAVPVLRRLRRRGVACILRAGGGEALRPVVATLGLLPWVEAFGPNGGAGATLFVSADREALTEGRARGVATLAVCRGHRGTRPGPVALNLWGVVEMLERQAAASA